MTFYESAREWFCTSVLLQRRVLLGIFLLGFALGCGFVWRIVG